MTPSKADLRARIGALRRTPRPAVDLTPWLDAAPAWRNAGTVAGYLAIRGELPVTDTLRAARARGARIVLPRVAGDRLAFHRWDTDADLVPGPFGLTEPSPDAPLVPPDDIDAWLVPGLAFDASGGRLGYGKGHYDRILPGAGGVTIGVGWSFQLVDAVPTDPWDVPLAAVLTDLGWAREP
jgi:5-formyltetrahydrofolate cyclo-ligase